jgi:hypothetical protein
VIGLTTTNDALEMVTSATPSTDYQVTYVDTTTTLHTPGSTQGNVASATTTTILSAPAASTYRAIRSLTVVNKGTVPQSLIIQKDVSGTNYVLFKCTLGPDEALVYSTDRGFEIRDRVGRAPSILAPGTTGGMADCSFTGTAAEAGSNHYFYSKDGGAFSKGIWSIGAPGVNGRTTDGTTSTDYGCVDLGANAASGFKRYLKRWDGTISTAPHLLYLVDVLWVNTGLVVTTTTAQAIVSGAMPARDADGSSNGRSLQIGLYFTAAATNAGAFSNATVDYTNEAGTAGRTATLSTGVGYILPATPVIGTMVWFQLQAGDRGVRSIQGITLGTSLVTGSVSLMVARIVCSSAANTGAVAFYQEFADPGIRIYDGSCLFPGYKAGGTTATTLQSQLQFVDK